jgi:exodeoxyribonuclease VII small subunit
MGDPKQSRRTARKASSKACPEEDTAEPQPISFEAALEQLETIVGRLEAGDLPLEESLELFESGIELSRRCNATLDSAERRIEILVAERGADRGDDAEAWVAQPFEAGIGDEPAGGVPDGSGHEA